MLAHQMRCCDRIEIWAVEHSLCNQNPSESCTLLCQHGQATNISLRVQLSGVMPPLHVCVISLPSTILLDKSVNNPTAGVNTRQGCATSAIHL